ncbi:MAG: carbohydrate ABC transporter permease [Acidimicrobiia bacterium]|nr:carbohydrate ABC transporter permease [Acidimicrobiia bacterium]
MALIVVFVALYLVPVAGVVSTSLKTNAEIAERGIWALTGKLTLANYIDVWSTANTVRYLINSFQVAIPAVAVSIAGGTLIGYALSKFRPRGGTLIQLVIVSGLFVPPQVLLVPLFTMFRTLDLLNTLWPMILIHSAVGFSICTLVMRNFFDQIPDSLRYAALIDGASEGDVFWRVMLPLARPALAALATLQFTFIWNDFLYPLVFTSARDDVATIMLGLLNVKGQFTVAYGTQASLAVIASIPTVVVFFVFQKHFVRGLLSGALKE